MNGANNPLNGALITHTQTGKRLGVSKMQAAFIIANGLQDARFDADQALKLKLNTAFCQVTDPECESG